MLRFFLKLLGFIEEEVTVSKVTTLPSTPTMEVMDLEGENLPSLYDYGDRIDYRKMFSEDPLMEVGHKVVESDEDYDDVSSETYITEGELVFSSDYETDSDSMYMETDDDLTDFDPSMDELEDLFESDSEYYYFNYPESESSDLDTEYYQYRGVKRFRPLRPYSDRLYALRGFDSEIEDPESYDCNVDHWFSETFDEEYVNNVL